MRSFNFATLGDSCGVSCVINSGCEFGVKIICCLLFVVFIDSFIVAYAHRHFSHELLHVLIQ